MALSGVSSLLCQPFLPFFFLVSFGGTEFLAAALLRTYQPLPHVRKRKTHHTRATASQNSTTASGGLQLSAGPGRCRIRYLLELPQSGGVASKILLIVAGVLDNINGGAFRISCCEDSATVAVDFGSWLTWGKRRYNLVLFLFVFLLFIAFAFVFLLVLSRLRLRLLLLTLLPLLLLLLLLIVLLHSLYFIFYFLFLLGRYGCLADDRRTESLVLQVARADEEVLGSTKYARRSCQQREIPTNTLVLGLKQILLSRRYCLQQAISQ